MAVIQTKQNDNNLAIAYYRYSSSAQDAISIERQRDEVRAYAQEKGLKIIKEYKDEAMSGTDSDRPDFQRMLTEVFQLKPAWLILWSSSRLGRDVADVRTAKKILRQAGCYYDYVAESTPSFTPDGQFMDALIDANNEKYSYTLSNDVRSGIQKKASLGLYQGVKIYGYKAVPSERVPKAREYAINEQQAKWVEFAFKECAKGTPLGEIARQMNAAGQKTAAGKPWTANLLSRVLKMVQYKGTYHYAGVEIEGGMPRIIDDKTFEGVSKVLLDNRRHSGAAKRKQALKTAPVASQGDVYHDFWLTRYLTCGECGRDMCGNSGHSRTGKAHYYYSCSGRLHKSGCTKSHVPAHILEDEVLDILWAFSSDTRRMSELAVDSYYEWKQQSKSDDTLKAMQKRLRDVEKEINNVIEVVCRMGDSTPKSLTDKLSELESAKDEVQSHIVLEENRLARAIDEHTIQSFYEKYAGADVENPDIRDKMLAYFVNEIIVYDDSIVVLGKYGDGDDDVTIVPSIDRENAGSYVRGEGNTGVVRTEMHDVHHTHNVRTARGFQVFGTASGLVFYKKLK